MEIIQLFLTGPVLPASCLLSLALLWSLIGIFGLVDLGLGDADVDVDVAPDVDLPIDAAVEVVGGDVEFDVADGGIDIGNSPGTDFHSADPSGVLSMAASGLDAIAWLNIGHVPIVVWGAVFSICWWGISVLSWYCVESMLIAPDNLLLVVPLVFVHAVVGALSAKLVTTPLKDKFRGEAITTKKIIGRECTISSTGATPKFGLVKMKTDGSPLLLNVRTDGPHLTQGTKVWITHYDESKRVYIVSPTTTNPSPDEPLKT